MAHILPNPGDLLVAGPNANEPLQYINTSQINPGFISGIGVQGDIPIYSGVFPPLFVDSGVNIADLLGSQGPQGNAGINGTQGLAGYQGNAGANGTQGYSGLQGPTLSKTAYLSQTGTATITSGSNHTNLVCNVVGYNLIPNFDVISVPGRYTNTDSVSHTYLFCMTTAISQSILDSFNTWGVSVSLSDTGYATNYASVSGVNSGRSGGTTMNASGIITLTAGSSCVWAFWQGSQGTPTLSAAIYAGSIVDVILLS